MILMKRGTYESMFACLIPMDIYMHTEKNLSDIFWTLLYS